MRNVLKYQLPPVLWIVTAAILAYFPDLFFRIKLPPGSDKIVHAGVYFMLCWLVKRAFYRQGVYPQLKKSALLGAFIFSCVYGILDEFQHNFFRDGSSDIYNLIAGVAGALLYVAIASLVSRRRDGGTAEPEG